MELLTIGESAEACDVSRDTIRRRLRDGAFPNAVVGEARGKRTPPWHIPRGDLERAGLAPRSIDAGADGLRGEPSCADLDALIAARDAHIADLRAEVERLHGLVRDLSGALASVLRKPDQSASAPGEPGRTFAGGPRNQAGTTTLEELG